jgi:Protein of unknown function (DUF4019)
LVILVFAIAAIAANRARAQTSSDNVAQARNAAEEWLNLIDKGDYRQSWINAASFFKDRVTMDEWEQQVGGVRDSLGIMTSRKFKSAKFVTSMPGAPDGKYVVLQYNTSFAHKKAAIETVTPMMDTDGEWRVSGYYIR